MATTNVAAGKIGAYAITLTASTVDTVTFADDISSVEVISDGAARLYFTTDGTTPTVGGNNCYMLPAGIVSSRTVKANASNGTTIKLISSGTPTYDVTR